jgi:hypothetical protein
LFPLQDRLWLRDNFGFLLREFRSKTLPFHALAKGPWSVFIAIATHFQTNAEAWPGQDAIATFSGCSTRAVRYHVADLERGGFLVLRRERRANGGERIFYSPGPVMRSALAAVRERYPKDRPKVLRPQPPSARLPASPIVPPTLNHPPEHIAGPPAETVAMEPRDQDHEPSSSCESAAATPAAVTVEEEEQPTVSKEDREIALWALKERMKRKYPKRPPPRWFDRADVEMVARCTAAVDGDRAAKEDANREAIAGAFAASKDGPPTARFIWEKLEHFVEHVERGRKKLNADARQALETQQRLSEREEDELLRRAWRRGVNAAADHARRSPLTREQIAKVRAEYEEIAARTAPEFRGVLQALIAECRADEAKARE